MGWKVRRTAPLSTLEAALVEESEAFLGGRYLELALEQAGDIPAWLWLSTLAHAEEARLLGDEAWPGAITAKRPEYETWARVLRLLGSEVRSLVEHSGCSLDEVQRDILVPLELAIMTSPVGPATLYRLVRSVLEHARQRVDSERP